LNLMSLIPGVLFGVSTPTLLASFISINTKTCTLKSLSPGFRNPNVCPLSNFLLGYFSTTG
jgi:hypothetical protein